MPVENNNKEKGTKWLLKPLLNGDGFLFLPNHLSTVDRTRSITIRIPKNDIKHLEKSIDAINNFNPNENQEKNENPIPTTKTIPIQLERLLNDLAESNTNLNVELTVEDSQRLAFIFGNNDLFKDLEPLLSMISLISIANDKLEDSFQFIEEWLDRANSYVYHEIRLRVLKLNKQSLEEINERIKQAHSKWLQFLNLLKNTSFDFMIPVLEFLATRYILLPVIGFTTQGIAFRSLAAWVMSKYGNIKAKSFFSFLQRFGMIGLPFSWQFFVGSEILTYLAKKGYSYATSTPIHVARL